MKYFCGAYEVVTLGLTHRSIASDAQGLVSEELDRLKTDVSFVRTFSFSHDFVLLNTNMHACALGKAVHNSSAVHVYSAVLFAILAAGL